MDSRIGSDPSRGAKPAQNRPFRGRGRDPDPGPLPAGDRERASGMSCPEASTRAASSAPMPRSWGWTASDSPMNTAASVEGTSGERGSESDLAPAATGGPQRPRRAAPRAGWLVVAAVVLVAALAIVALPVGGGDDASPAVRPRRKAPAGEPRSRAGGEPTARLAGSRCGWRPAPKSGSACSTPRASTWSTARSSKREPKRARSAPVASRSHSATGRSRCSSMAEEAEIPATSSPIGYSIDSSGRLTELAEAERPTCT